MNTEAVSPRFTPESTSIPLLNNEKSSSTLDDKVQSTAVGVLNSTVPPAKTYRGQKVVAILILLGGVTGVVAGAVLSQPVVIVAGAICTIAGLILLVKVSKAAVKAAKMHTQAVQAQANAAKSAGDTAALKTETEKKEKEAESTRLAAEEAQRKLEVQQKATEDQVTLKKAAAETGQKEEEAKVAQEAEEATNKAAEAERVALQAEAEAKKQQEEKPSSPVASSGLTVEIPSDEVPKTLIAGKSTSTPASRVLSDSTLPPPVPRTNNNSSKSPEIVRGSDGTFNPMEVLNGLRASRDFSANSPKTPVTPREAAIVSSKFPVGDTGTSLVSTHVAAESPKPLFGSRRQSLSTNSSAAIVREKTPELEPQQVPVIETERHISARQVASLATTSATRRNSAPTLLGSGSQGQEPIRRVSGNSSLTETLNRTTGSKVRMDPASRAVQTDKSGKARKEAYLTAANSNKADSK